MRSIISEGHSQHPDGRFRSTQGNALFAALHKHVRCVRTGTRDFKILELVVGFFWRRKASKKALALSGSRPLWVVGEGGEEGGLQSTGKVNLLNLGLSLYHVSQPLFLHPLENRYFRGQ